MVRKGAGIKYARYLLSHREALQLPAMQSLLPSTTWGMDSCWGWGAWFTSPREVTVSVSHRPLYCSSPAGPRPQDNSNLSQSRCSPRHLHNKSFTRRQIIHRRRWAIHTYLNSCVSTGRRCEKVKSADIFPDRLIGKVSRPNSQVPWTVEHVPVPGSLHWEREHLGKNRNAAFTNHFNCQPQLLQLKCGW